jgi:predicted AlkP superfamily pyrophosphatase or phosphodiesterase
MRHHALRSSAFVLLSVIVASLLVAAQGPQSAGVSNHVVIISLDGFKASALADESLPVPTLRRLAARGAVATGMRPVNPTVTWPNHTSMITGVTPARHGVIFNGLLIREPGVPPHVEPWRDKEEMVHAPTLYDIAHQRGLTTAQVDWVAIWNAPAVTWEFRERPDPQGLVAREMIEAGLVSQAALDDFAGKNIVFKDHVWTHAAAHIIREHRPNVMMFHLLTLDSIQHRHGPGTLAATAAMAHLDSQVATIVEAVDQAGLSTRTTFVIVSDHGFKPVRRQVMPNAAFLNAGLLQASDGTVTSASAYLMSEGGTAFVYLTVPDPDAQLLGRVKAVLTGLEGIESIIEPADYPSYGLPAPAESDQVGALLLTAKDGYAFSAAVGPLVVADAVEGSLGAHGYVSADPELQALFIASGRGIKTGVTLESMNTIDLAPTISRLLGIELKDVQGRVLSEILTDP